MNSLQLSFFLVTVSQVSQLNEKVFFVWGISEILWSVCEAVRTARL